MDGEREGVDTAQLTPGRIMQLGLGFWGSKALLSAVELGVFTELAKEPLDAKMLAERLRLHPRSARDFFDALVVLGMLYRNRSKYTNTTETDFFLDRAKPSYMGGILEMANARLYPFWGSLTEALRTGKPQNEIKKGQDLFSALYGDPKRLRVFLQGMTGLSLGAARVIAAKFPWGEYKTFIDIGGAQGTSSGAMRVEPIWVTSSGERSSMGMLSPEGSERSIELKGAAT